MKVFGLVLATLLATTTSTAAPRHTTHANMRTHPLNPPGETCKTAVKQVSHNLWSVDPQALDCRGMTFVEFSGYPPQAAAFGDAENFVLTDVLQFKLGPNNDQPISIPKGFVTDLASVPPSLRGFFPHDGQYMSAAIVHDYLYWDQRCTKDQSDLILYREILKFGVSKSTAWKIYHAVSWFGQKAWDQNAAEKGKRVRVVPEPYLNQYLHQDMTAASTWERLQRELQAAGVSAAPDNGNPNIAAICVIAGS